MSNYQPDKWLVVKIGEENLYKVFACWYGGYLGSDSWKLNSGITKATLEGNVFSFEGSSGSVYHCHKDLYGANMYGLSVLEGMIDKAKKNDIVIDILPEKTDWLGLKYE
jgi:hypothetical protein